MPKMKTNRMAKKKLFPNKNGKVKRGHAFHSHMTGKKSAKRKRNLSKMCAVDKTNVKAVRLLLPYA
jgi:large subunit ribosomal protein L35